MRFSPTSCRRVPPALSFILIMIISGCSVGGQYGYSQKFVEAPNRTQLVATSNHSSNLLGLTKQFLEKWLNCGGILKDEPSGYNHADYKLSGSQGCVMEGDPQWELIQISFIQTGDDYNPVVVTTDGWLASGFNRPVTEARYTKSMEKGKLDAFTEQMASGFRQYVIEHQ